MRRLSIEIVTPVPRGSRAGNRVTALRWAALLRSLAHEVRITTSYESGAVDLVIALHARRSHASIRRFRDAFAEGQLAVALPGTDVYRDIHHDRDSCLSLELASRLVVLQTAAVLELPEKLRGKARVIVQSAEPHARKRKSRSPLRLIAVGHLRPEKDPFRLVEALSLIPDTPLEALHVGKALAADLEEAARAWMRRETRYRWKGELPPSRARQMIADSDALVLSSVLEGGANVISEAVVCSVPVLASRIPSSVALLGEDYDGYFEVGDSGELATLIKRFVGEPGFRARLKRQVQRLRPNFSPRREREAWRRLIAELFPVRRASRS
ncbi:MAG TPA: selenoneine biosynthesis selenosugar synthase SenB [Thermoanaerobaculia bacterium]|nr:selenoneine biosynthesis selenosugar synthase SenB [Thermoanaerobaculia bacterium]